MAKITGSAQRSLDRTVRRERRIQRRKNRMPVSGRGLLTVTERLQQKQQAEREKAERKEKEQRQAGE